MTIWRLQEPRSGENERLSLERGYATKISNGAEIIETCAEFRASRVFYGGDDRKSQAAGAPYPIAIVADAGNLKAYVAMDDEPSVRRHGVRKSYTPRIFVMDSVAHTEPPKWTG